MKCKMFNKDVLSHTERVCWNIAENAHANQTRIGGGSYFDNHIFEVFFYLYEMIEELKFFTNEYIITSVALLHDILEDCEGWTYEKLLNELILGGVSENDATSICDNVLLLTKIDRKDGSFSLTDYLRNIFLEGSPCAIIVKLADRINNLHDMHSLTLWKKEKKLKYIQESKTMVDYTFIRLLSSWETSSGNEYLTDNHLILIHDEIVLLRKIIHENKILLNRT